MSTTSLDLMIGKYEKYISNLEWHLRVNKPQKEEERKCLIRIICYREAMNDFKLLNQKKEKV